MSSSNLKHLFIDGRRVTFDRRDNSVTLFPDNDFRFIAAEHIGHAKGSDRSWTATTPEGTARHCDGRKDAALWLIDQTSERRTNRERSQSIRRTSEAGATEEAMELIKLVRPDYPRPRPLNSDPNGAVYFVFGPAELRDLLLDSRKTPTADR